MIHHLRHRCVSGRDFFVPCLLLFAMDMIIAGPVPALEAAVKPAHGSPMIHVDGRPVSPLMFFGWESAFGGPTCVELTTEWREYSITVISPEDTDGASGIHFRMGGEGPGTVWVDDVRVYPGDKADPPPVNRVRRGDFEGTREEIEGDWRFYQTAGAEAAWALDTETKAAGQQSLRIDIAKAGTDHMHLHWYQTGYSVKRAEKYTYSLWMKADKPRTVDFMMLHINDPWTIYPAEIVPGTPYVQQLRLARDAGVHVHSFGISMPWPQPGEEPDFAAVDRCMEVTLREDPAALMLPRFDMSPPGWWLEQHPDDRLLFDDGKTVSVSVASEAWRADMQERLRDLVRHCESKYGDHILGYHPCGQHTGEWFYERSWEPCLSDFSPAMDAGFRNWLRSRYGDLEGLQQAWNDTAVSFESVRVPAADRQRATTLGFFRDPAVERPVIDYFLYKQVAMVEPLEMMALVIKQETGGRKLTCFFYGYLFDMHGIPMGPQNCGHLAMARLLACPDVDILCSPISYLDRELGGAGMFMSAVDSVRRHGKLWLNEDDTRTYLTPPDSGFGRVDTPAGTFWVHQRNFAQLWPRRLASWYMDLGGIGWLNGQDIWDNIRRLQEFYGTHLKEPAMWNPETVLIVDEDSPLYTACDRRLHSPLVYEMRSQYFRMGAPFSIFLLSDLVAGNVPPAKVYFFANCHHLDGRQRDAVAQITKGKTAVWFYGGGFLNDRADDDNIAEVTGLPVKRIPPEPGRAIPVQAEEGLATALSEPFGTETVLDPLWTVDTPDAEVIARYSSGNVAAAAKLMPDGLRVYIGTLHYPARLLRNILKASGVHVYCDSDDVVLTDDRFLGLTATSPGKKSLSLPRPATVMDALSGAVIEEAAQSLALDMTTGETRLFLLR